MSASILVVEDEPSIQSLIEVNLRRAGHTVILAADAVLKKPLNRLFSYRYHVTGTWADPLVNKAGESVQELSPPADTEKESKP